MQQLLKFGFNQPDFDPNNTAMYSTKFHMSPPVIERLKRFVDPKDYSEVGPLMDDNNFMYNYFQCDGAICYYTQPLDRSTGLFSFHGHLNHQSFLFDSFTQKFELEYIALLTVFSFSFIFVILISVISRLYPETASLFYNFEQTSSYECGFAPFGVLNKPQLLLFYKLAVFFIIFEAELIFLYP